MKNVLTLGLVLLLVLNFTGCMAKEEFENTVSLEEYFEVLLKLTDTDIAEGIGKLCETSSRLIGLPETAVKGNVFWSINQEKSSLSTYYEAKYVIFGYIADISISFYKGKADAVSYCWEGLNRLEKVKFNAFQVYTESEEITVNGGEIVNSDYWMNALAESMGYNNDLEYCFRWIYLNPIEERYHVSFSDLYKNLDLFEINLCFLRISKANKI